MKRFLFALGLIAAVAAGAAEGTTHYLQDDWADKGVPFPQNREFSRLDADTRKAELERFLPLVQKSDSLIGKIAYTHLATAFWFSQTPCDTFAELEAKFDEIFATTNPPKTLTELQKDRILNFKLCSYGGYAGTDEGVASRTKKFDQEAFDRYGEKTGHFSSSQMGWIVYGLTGDLNKAEPYWIKSGHLSVIIRLRINDKDLSKGAEYFWQELGKGTLQVDIAQDAFPRILAYELEQENFDAAALKSKLNKAILIYKSKARQWKPTKEGESNPYIEFVGMLQDTAKDL